MKLLLLFNKLFLYLGALHQNLYFLKQTCTFLHLLTQLSSLSCVCFICRGIFNFAAAFLFPHVCLFWHNFFYFASAFLFCYGFFVLSWFLVLPWLFYFYRSFFASPWLFYFAVNFSFCFSCFVLPWFLPCHGFLFCRGFLFLSWHLWATVETNFTPNKANYHIWFFHAKYYMKI